MPCSVHQETLTQIKKREKKEVAHIKLATSRDYTRTILKELFIFTPIHLGFIYVYGYAYLNKNPCYDTNFSASVYHQIETALFSCIPGCECRICGMHI